jgi:hypothetical protein
LPNPTSSSCPQTSTRFLLDAHAANQITYIRWHYLLDNGRSLTIRRFTHLQATALSSKTGQARFCGSL